MGESVSARTDTAFWVSGFNKYGCNRKKRSADVERISALEKENFANPTVATADRLLYARPWKGNTLVGFFVVKSSLAIYIFQKCIHSVF